MTKVKYKIEWNVDKICLLNGVLFFLFNLFVKTRGIKKAYYLICITSLQNVTLFHYENLNIGEERYWSFSDSLNKKVPLVNQDLQIRTMILTAKPFALSPHPIGSFIRSDRGLGLLDARLQYPAKRVPAFENNELYPVVLY